MRTQPNMNDKYDKQELVQLNAEQWQIDLLKLNPEYVFWGNFEDGMSNKDSNWRSPLTIINWKNFNWELDKFNEVVNFYFEIYREGHECPHCAGSSYNKETKQIADDWYDFEETGNRWCDKINDTEVEELAKHGRLYDFMSNWYRFNKNKNSWVYLKEEPDKPRNEWEWIECKKPNLPSAKQVNTWERGRSLGHDGINRTICVESRARQKNIYGHCLHCIDGFIYDEEKARVGLQLWILYPRKGYSRGVYIEQIEKVDLTSIFTFLKGAAQRNAQRFSGITK